MNRLASPAQLRASFYRWALFLVPAAWLVGGLAALAVKAQVTSPLQPFSFLLVGILIAADLRLPVAAVTAVALAVGLVHGFLNGIAMRAAGPAGGTLELLGITATVFVLIALFAAAVVSVRAHWARIVVRVAGSWIAAIGLLMLGWALRPR